MLQIALAIVGIVILCTGKFKVSANKVVEGTAARLLALILLAPFPLAFILGMVVGGWAAAEGKPLEEIRMVLMVIDVGVTLAAAIIAFTIAAIIARPPYDENEVEAYQGWQAYASNPPPSDPNSSYKSPYA